MKFQYSTHDIEAPRRFEYWNEVVCQHCIPAASECLDRAPFDGELDVSLVGAVSISMMTSPWHQWRRSSQHIRTGPDDDLWLGYMKHGDAYISQGERRVHLRSGDITLYDAARPFEFRLAPEQIYLVRLPRRSLLSRSPHAEQMTARIIDRQRPGAQALRSMIEEAAFTNFSDPDTAARYGSAILDVLSLTIDDYPDKHSSAGERDLYTRLLSYIRENFSDTELNLHSLALAHHVSERTVTRAFARHNQTPMDVVRMTRLQASHRELAEGMADSVTRTALNCGFTDLSHFSRVFRATYGYTPQSLLLQAPHAHSAR